MFWCIPGDNFISVKVQETCNGKMVVVMLMQMRRSFDEPAHLQRHPDSGKHQTLSVLVHSRRRLYQREGQETCNGKMVLVMLVQMRKRVDELTHPCK